MRRLNFNFIIQTGQIKTKLQKGRAMRKKCDMNKELDNTFLFGDD